MLPACPVDGYACRYTRDENVGSLNATGLPGGLLRNTCEHHGFRAGSVKLHRASRWHLTVCHRLDLAKNVTIPRASLGHFPISCQYFSSLQWHTNAAHNVTPTFRCIPDWDVASAPWSLRAIRAASGVAPRFSRACPRRRCSSRPNRRGGCTVPNGRLPAVR